MNSTGATYNTFGGDRASAPVLAFISSGSLRYPSGHPLVHTIMQPDGLMLLNLKNKEESEFKINTDRDFRISLFQHNEGVRYKLFVYRKTIEPITISFDGETQAITVDGSESESISILDIEVVKLGNRLVNKIQPNSESISKAISEANVFSDTQEDRLKELVYEAVTASLSVSPSSFEKGLATNVTWSWNVAAHDDNIEVATFDGNEISNELVSSNTYSLENSESKSLAISVTKSANNKNITRSCNALNPQFKGYTSAVLDGSYANSNANLTRFISSSANADVVVSSLISNAKVVFISTKSNAAIYDANDFPITSAFAKTSFEQKLANGTIVTLYKYETIAPATLGTYKLR